MNIDAYNSCIFTMYQKIYEPFLHAQTAKTDLENVGNNVVVL